MTKEYRTAQRLRPGAVWVDTWDVFDATLPSAGTRESGGGREMGHEVLNSFTESKTSITDLS